MMSTAENLTQTNAGSTPTASVGHPINTGPGDVSILVVFVSRVLDEITLT